MARPRPPRPLDDRDRRILSELRADAWLTYAALAKRVHLSASAVQRRVERLIAERTLLGANARTAPHAMERPQRIYALVELRDDQRATVQAFSAHLAKSPLVVEAHWVAGEADVVLTLQVATLADYTAFVDERLTRSELVRRFKTLTSLRSLKSINDGR